MVEYTWVMEHTVDIGVHLGNGVNTQGNWSTLG